MSAATGQYREASEEYERGLEAARRQHDPLAESTLDLNLGDLSHTIGQVTKAKGYFEASLTLARSLKDRAAEAAVLNNLGGLGTEIGDPNEAFTDLKDSLSIREEIQDRAGLPVALLNMGGLSEGVGNKNQAHEFFEESRKMAHELGNRGVEAASLNALSDFTNNADEEMADLETALSLVVATPVRPTAADPYPVRRHADILDTQVAQIVLNNIGYVLYVTGETARQNGQAREEKIKLTAAVPYLQLARDLVEDARAGTRPTDIETQNTQAEFLTKHFGPYELLVAAELRLYDLDPAGTWERKRLRLRNGPSRAPSWIC